jgi:hypothetical protein
VSRPLAYRFRKENVSYSLSSEGKELLESYVLPLYSAYASAVTVRCHGFPYSFHMNAGKLS